MGKTTLGRVSGSRVTSQTVRYRERLWVPWWWWPLGFGVAGLIAQADRGALGSGQQIVVTVTGHGLKDIDTALTHAGPVHAEVVPADLLAIATVCGLVD